VFVVLFSDYIVVGSDSGRIVILEYISAKNIFEKVHQETFGKSGCRRIVPGQYLAIDPKGRAVMIGNDNGLLCMLVVVYNAIKQ
jgi:splicing factor 3B subunit 3